MNNRRDFITLVGGAGVALPLLWLLAWFSARRPQ
jgi:hypothetical protein